MEELLSWRNCIGGRHYLPIPTRRVCWPSGWLWSEVSSYAPAEALSGKSSPCLERSQSLLRSKQAARFIMTYYQACDGARLYRYTSLRFTAAHPYRCSCAGSGWKWLRGCSVPCSWVPREAECHHPPPEWGACEQGQGQGMKTGTEIVGESG